MIIPFRNEARWIDRTLQCVADQEPRPALVLVDNGSTDDGVAIAMKACAQLSLEARLVQEPTPGKVYALAAGLGHVRTLFIATFDADTFYPPDYLHAAQRLLEGQQCVAAQAYYTRPGWSVLRCAIESAKLSSATWLLPHQCHNGGAGQLFRTDALKRSGGFDPERWPLILEDHEVIHRISALGRVACASRLWCSPARRERDHPATRWTLLERIFYHLAPQSLQSHFFYRFLGPRLALRQAGGQAPQRRSQRLAGLARCAD